MIKALALLFERPLAQHAIRLAAAARAAEENFLQMGRARAAAAQLAAATPTGLARAWRAVPAVKFFGQRCPNVEAG
jgi:hypothetical protein